jgi:hypothetical protein
VQEISESVDRASAVKELSAHVADRDAFLVAVSLRRFAEQAHAFCDGTVPSWTAYIDMGGQSVLRTADPALLVALTRSDPGSVVLAVPKTVPAAVLGRVFQQPFPEDGLCDLLDLELDHQPTLVFDAMEIVDPEGGAAMRAAMHASRPKVAAL